MSTLDRLNRQLDQEQKHHEEGYPDTFDFEEPGDQIIGRLEEARFGVDHSRSEEFGLGNVIVLSTKDGQRSVWLTKTVLKQKVLDHNPRIGDVVAIRYLGEKDSEQAIDSYHNFAVAVDRQSVGDHQRSLKSMQQSQSLPENGDTKELTAPDDNLPF